MTDYTVQGPTPVLTDPPAVLTPAVLVPATVNDPPATVSVPDATIQLASPILAGDTVTVGIGTAKVKLVGPLIVPVPPPPPTGVGATWAAWAPHPFGSYPTSAAINVTSMSDPLIKGGVLEVTGKTFKGNLTGTSGAALRFQYLHDITIWLHDLDFDSLTWSAINILSCQNVRLQIEGNRYREQTRNFVQIATGSICSGYIANNKGKGGLTEDVINTNASSGVSDVQRLELRYNSFEGTDWTSGSGSGMALADGSGSYIWSHHNTVLNVAQVGLFISNGTYNRITDNVIYGAKITRAIQGAPGWQGIYTPYGGYGATNPGHHEVSRNRSFFLDPSGNQKPFWDGGASGPVDGISTNVFPDPTIDPATLAVTL